MFYFVTLKLLSQLHATIWHGMRAIYATLCQWSSIHHQRNSIPFMCECAVGWLLVVFNIEQLSLLDARNSAFWNFRRTTHSCLCVSIECRNCVLYVDTFRWSFMRVFVSFVFFFCYLIHRSFVCGRVLASNFWIENCEKTNKIIRWKIWKSIRMDIKHGESVEKNEYPKAASKWEWELNRNRFVICCRNVQVCVCVWERWSSTWTVFHLFSIRTELEFMISIGKCTEIDSAKRY